MSVSSEADSDADDANFTKLEDFPLVHLSTPPQRLCKKIMGDLSLLEQIRNLQDGDLEDDDDGLRGLRDLTASFLEDASWHVFDLLRPSERPPTHLVFKDYHKALGSHPYATVKATPSIIGSYTPEEAWPKKRYMPWHRAETIVLVTPCKYIFYNLTRFAKYLLQARPDCPGVYGLTWNFSYDEQRGCNVVEYRMLWADAAGIVSSRWYTLNATTNWMPLLSFIYSFYVPPKGHCLRDPSITWQEATRFGKATWTIKCGKQKYSGCTMLCTGDFNRRTTVFKYCKGDSLCIIKDCYWDKMKEQEEGAVLKAVHQKGIVPGVVRFREQCNVYDSSTRRIWTAASKSIPGSHDRFRTRLVLTSTGTGLKTAKSVKDLLMAVYDVNEAHRYLAFSGEILHRDMSAYNLLMYPEHDNHTRKRFIKDGPTFISAVLGEKGCNEAQGLIIDFDISASLRKHETRYRAEKNLYIPVGTQSFMSRSNSSGEPLRTNSFTCMPELDGEAKARYVDAYSQERYDAYTDRKDTWHGVPRQFMDFSRADYWHRPRHDVESIFWSLVYTFLQLRPRGDDEETTLSDHALFTWARIRAHRSRAHEGDFRPQDTRDVLFRYTEEDWREALHPGLGSLAPLIIQLARQIAPEYNLLARWPVADHLHEAVRRILLARIVALDDPIALKAGERRDLPWDVDEIDIDDRRGWRPHWQEGGHLRHLEENARLEKERLEKERLEKEQLEKNRLEKEEKLVLRLRKPRPCALKRRADDGAEDGGQEVKSPVRAKRQKVSH